MSCITKDLFYFLHGIQLYTLQCSELRVEICLRELLIVCLSLVASNLACYSFSVITQNSFTVSFFKNLSSLLDHDV